ncbi:FtsX-like permease family protein [Arthrobacter sp. TMN-49]
MPLDLKPVKGGRRHRLRLALTMAWRDICRHKGRSALIIALIALPIFAMSTAATIGMSTQATPAETVAMELGQTQGRLTDMGTQNATSVQRVQGDLMFGLGGPGVGPDPNFVATAPADAVPAGFTAIPWQSTTVHTPVGKAQVEVPTTVTDVLNPAFKGKYTLLDGAAPSSAAQALASRGLLVRFGLGLGEELTTSAGTFEIVGTIRPERQGDGEAFLFLSAKQIPAAMAPNLGPATIYLVGDKALAWTDAKTFNAKGITLTSRSLLLDPPSKAELGADAQNQQTNAGLAAMMPVLLMGGLIGVLALLEVGLLAGAAFAVGARKQQRDLALLAASGAESSMVRTTVTASGLWLGLAGGMAGAVLGSAAAMLVVVIVRGQGNAMFPGLHLMWLPALGLVLLGVAAGLVAAMVPARAVARQATLAALKSGRTADLPSRWTKWLGLGFLVLAAMAMAAGVVVSVMVRGRDDSYVWVPLSSGLIIGGAVVLVLALICLTGRIIELLTAKTAWLPVPLRLAARDSARNLGRTIPAVAAVLAAATLSGALMVGTASAMEDNSNNHQWQYNLNQTGIPLEYMKTKTTDLGGGAQKWEPQGLATVDPRDVTTLMADTLGPDVTTQVLRGTPQWSQCELDQQKRNLENNTGHEVPNATPCPKWALAEPVANRCELAPDWKPAILGDWRCAGSKSSLNLGSSLPDIVAGGEAELAALLGRVPSARALQALRDGGMVITNKVYLQPDGTAKVISYDPASPRNWDQNIPGKSGGQFMRPLLTPLGAQALPAVVEAPEKSLGFYGVVSPETAAKLDMPVSNQTLLVTSPKSLSQVETDQLQSALAPLVGQYNGVQFERGPAGNMATILWLIVAGGALITLSAAGITAGLALADGRNDHATLASIGADTKLRKAISGSQTLMTAMLGTVMGVFAGAVPTVVVLSLLRGFPIVIPWLQIAALMILVPLFGAAAAWLLTKGKLPMTRRQTLV